MKRYRITLLLKDDTEFEKIDYFENYEEARAEADKAFEKSRAIVAYEVEEVFK